MEEIRAKVITRLKSPDANLWPGLAIGGIYDYRLSKNEEGGTPAAFGALPGEEIDLKRVRNSIVILGPNDVDPPDGATNKADVHNRNGFLRFHMYAPATAQGKLDMDAMDARCMAALRGWQTMLSTNRVVTITPLDATESTDSDEWEFTKIKIRRYLAEWMSDPWL